MAVLLNFGIRALDDQVRNDSSTLHNVTGIIGTSVSGGFLSIIAALNIILVGILRDFREMRSGRYNDAELGAQLDKRGLMNRFFGPIARRADTPWTMHPVGVLFGLGFDTATEVALLVLAGSAVVGRLAQGRWGRSDHPARRVNPPERGPRACRAITADLAR